MAAAKSSGADATRSVTANRDAFIVHGKPRFLRGATLQWFRLPEECWGSRLDAIKAGRWNTVDMYVPWSDIEPEEGMFDQAALAKMVRFVKACEERGLYIYLRPGPYICNEQDFGGMAPWLIKKASKRPDPKSEEVDIRTSDPKWLALCERYLGAVNEALRPFFGKTIVLYAIENEHNWFQVTHALEKIMRKDGKSERALFDRIDTTGYLDALRRIVEADGVHVPITTCPGIPALVGMGEVRDVIPMPNDYLPGKSEWKAYKLRSEMHGTKHRKIHGDHPTGITESPPDPLIMSRFLMGGMDAFMGFNTAGMHQDGLRNAILPDPKALMEKGIIRGLREFDIGYFTGVFDVGGPITSTGGLRDSFFEFHRVNAFFDAFEHVLAPLGSPSRTGHVGPFGSRGDERVKVNDGRIGASETFGRVRYFFDAGGGNYFISLLNDRDRPVRLGLGSIEVEGEKLPKHVPMEIRATSNPIMVTGYPLTPGARLGYTTAEILTERAFNGGRLLVIYGESGSPERASMGELALDRLSGAPRILHKDPKIEVKESDDASLVVTFPYDADRFLALETREGERIDILVTTRDRAGRTWFMEDGDRDVALTGLDLVVPERKDGGVELRFEHAEAEADVTIISDGPVALPGFTEVAAFDLETGATRFRRSCAVAVPDLPEGFLAGGARVRLAAEAEPDFDDSAWAELSGEPQPLERFDIFQGHAWYRTEVTLDAAALEKLAKSDRLTIRSASDFVGVYVNGQYVTTVAPHGTEIDSAHPKNERYSFEGIAQNLREGRNVLAFRTEIWGHGSFPLPGGSVPITGASAPSISPISMRGLQGEAKLGDVPLDRWKVRGGMVPEGRGVSAAEGEDRGMPGALEPGEVTCYETQFDRADWPEDPSVRAPLAIELRGKNAKATVYLNPPRTADGKIDLHRAGPSVIGRWLSDEAWLNRGTWAHALRDMWSVASPDCFPIPGERLREGNNDLAILFEDTSEAKGEAGQIDGVRLVHMPDRPMARGTTRLVSTLS